MELLRRERDAEVAKADYTVYALALIHGMDPKVIETKLKMLASLRSTMVDVITHDAYNPQLKKQKLEQQKDAQRRQAELIDKVAKLGKSG